MNCFNLVHFIWLEIEKNAHFCSCLLSHGETATVQVRVKIQVSHLLPSSGKKKTYCDITSILRTQNDDWVFLRASIKSPPFFHEHDFLLCN